MRGTFLHVLGWVCDCPYNNVGEQNWSWCQFGHFGFFAKVFHLSWQEMRRGLLHWGRVVEEERGRRHRDGFAHWSFSNFLLILQRYHWLCWFKYSDCIQRGRSGQFNSPVSTDTAENSNPLKAWSWSSNVTSARTRCQKLWYMWNCVGWVLPWEGGVHHQWCVKVARQSAGRFSSRYGQPPTPTCATALPSTTLSSSYLKGSPIIFCSTV